MAAASSAESSEQSGQRDAPQSASGGMFPQVFRREGEYWTVEFEGLVCRLKHTRGMQHLAVLLARPWKRVPAIELAGGILSDHPLLTEVFGGKGTEPRPTTRDAERARVNVTRQITSVVKRIAEHHPVLGRHLDTTIHTGALCSYTPDTRLSARWEP